MPALAENPRAVVGDNRPPMTPYEIAEKAVNDIYDECMLWLDGKTVDSQALADGVGNLLTEIRKAEKLADDSRKAEKAQLDEQVKEIQSRYNLLIGETKTVKGKTVLAAEACKTALKPWLEAEAARIAEEARLRREEADRQLAAAQAALQASDAANLAERAAAEELLGAAKKAETVANKAERVTATAGGVFGRAIGLRTVHKVRIDDEVAAVRHVWMVAREEMLAFVTEWAERQVRLGVRNIKGFEVTETKVAA